VNKWSPRLLTISVCLPGVRRDGSNNVFTLFDPACTTSLGVDLRQPLPRNRAIDPARASLRVTALDRERSGAALASIACFGGAACRSSSLRSSGW